MSFCNLKTNLHICVQKKGLNCSKLLVCSQIQYKHKIISKSTNLGPNSDERCFQGGCFCPIQKNPTFWGKFKVNFNEKKCPKIKVKGHTWSYIVSKGQILFGGHFITFKDIV